MAITKGAVVPLITASTGNSVAGTTSKGTPSVTGLLVDCSTYYGGDLVYSIKNDGAGAPAAAATILFQTSPDGGSTWYDYAPIGGDTNAYVAGTGVGLTTGTIWLDQGVKAVRAIAFGNTTNNVTVSAALTPITAV